MMVEVSEADQETMAFVFTSIIDLLIDSKLPPYLVTALILKISVMQVQGHLPDKDLFLEQAGEVWDMEKFMNPFSSDIH
jgi:hypothetical protein